MKKIIYITAMLIGTCSIINAQTDTVNVPAPADKKYVKESTSEAAPAENNIEKVNYNRDARRSFQFGFKAGVNYSNIYDVASDNFTADYKFGFAGGIFMSIPIGKYLGVQPEFLYSEKGYEVAGSVEGSAFNNTHKSKYLDIPIYLQLKPNDVLTVVVGPQISWLFDKTNDFSDSFLSADQEQQFDNIDISKFTFGVSGGLDFNIGHVVLGGRMGWDLSQNNGQGTTISPQYRNMWYQATLGFRF